MLSGPRKTLQGERSVDAGVFFQTGPMLVNGISCSLGFGVCEEDPAIGSLVEDEPGFHRRQRSLKEV